MLQTSLLTSDTLAISNLTTISKEMITLLSECVFSFTPEFKMSTNLHALLLRIDKANSFEDAKRYLQRVQRILDMGTTTGLMYYAANFLILAIRLNKQPEHEDTYYRLLAKAYRFFKYR